MDRTRDASLEGQDGLGESKGGASSARESSGAKVVTSLFLPGSELNIGAAFGELEVCKLAIKTELLRQPLAFTALEIELEVRKIGAIAALLGGF